MPNPLPLPLRVLVKGPSLVNWTYPTGGPRTDFTFPRAIEANLLAEGRPCEVRAITMTSELASDLLKTWQREILGYSPDVIVMHYGGYDIVHVLLPRWLEKHANSMAARPRLPFVLYRRFLLRPVWKMLAKIQYQVDKRFPTYGKRKIRRMIKDLEAYITRVQMVGSPMVILLEMHKTTARRLKWFPSVNDRALVANQAVAEMVERFDQPHIRYFGIRELIEKHFDGDYDVAISDGFHFSPAMHAVAGAALAETIADWADTQPHLARKPD